MNRQVSLSVETAVSDDDCKSGQAGISGEESVNETCPWSGKPVSTDALTFYKGHVMGFCNTGCRDKFEKAIRHFDQALSRR